ncbi:MAG: hypothetical protein ABW168_00305 [Sedimenticola sp.]
MTTKSSQAADLINFHGLTLLVAESEGVKYLPAKPLADLARVDWRSAKKTIQERDNAILYGTTWLIPPVFAAEGGTSTPTKPALYIRLDRSTMYLARINTKMMRGKGSEDAAEALLTLQIEWAQALHAYETNGFATKPDQAATTIIKVIAQIDRIKSSSLKQVAAQHANSELGLEIPTGKQQSLDIE